MEKLQVEEIQKLRKKIKSKLDKIIPHPYYSKGNKLKSEVIDMVNRIVEMAIQ